MEVSLGLLDDSVKYNALIVTHRPRFQKNAPEKKKMPSNEIRDAIELNSSLRKKLFFIVLLNKYDIFCMVHEQMLIQPAVQEIGSLGDMIVASATTQHCITAREVSRTVAPPFVLVRFPPIYAIPDIIRSAATFGPVDGHQIFQQSGILLVKYQSTQSAAASYGATLPRPVYFTSGTDHDTTTSIADRLQSVSLTDLPSPLLNEANLAAFVGSELSPFNMPDVVSGGDVSPVPSILPDHSARASDHRMSHPPPAVSPTSPLSTQVTRTFISPQLARMACPPRRYTMLLISICIRPHPRSSIAYLCPCLHFYSVPRSE